MIIRAAQLDEAPALTVVALRAKAYWGYDAAFMEAVREEMTISPEYLATHIAFVLEEDGEIKGFYKLGPVSTERVELTDLFVDPTVIGQGWGRMLWDHAVAMAISRGYLQMTWESDPHAEGFYVRMGGVRTGEVQSTVTPERRLPRMSYQLRDGDREG